MEMRGMMGGFYKISEWIMRLAVTNLLWVICSLPVAFLLLTSLMSKNAGEVYSWLVLTLIVSPFTLFPATSAMFAVARKWVMGEVDAPLFKTFFRGYKQNYVQSMVGGILYALLFIIMVVDFRVYLAEPNLQLISYIFIGLMILLSISLFNFFSMVVHYHMKTMQLLKNAVLITIGRPLRSLSTAIVSGVILYISFYKFTFLIPFFMGSIIAYFSFWNFYMVYQKIQSQMEKDEAAAEEDPLDEDLTESTKK
ncbi:YesL family protein [Paenibacillus beijingensis]|uniref:Membrane protein n=1 Tax=Paenibacillus beijingensis TaxID=1126833 RepID=A0A0D5NDZ1_9BACL|nr:DUF624 domain-containing protein [Paenibacillus beijingensis]AJY73375.1 membrane protein [Paenibacillus beijingensis]